MFSCQESKDENGKSDNNKNDSLSDNENVVYATVDERLNKDEVIISIRTVFEEINKSESALKKETFESYLPSSEGGEIDYFTDKSGNIVKIHHKVYGEGGHFEEEYYFNENELIFMFTRDFTYNAPNFVDEKMAEENGTEAYDSSKDKIVQNRYYFYDGKLYFWLDNDRKEISIENEEFASAQEAAYISVDEMKEYYKSVKSK